MASTGVRSHSDGSANVAVHPAVCGTYSSDLWREAAVGLEWLELRCAPVRAGIGVPRGNGAPVIVVPGLFASDACTSELRAWLARIGYRSYPSGIGVNMQCPQSLVERLVTTAENVYAACGRRATMVGHSLGGLLARGAAMRRPELVAAVVTLGSPVHGIRVHPAIAAAAQAVSCGCEARCLLGLQAALPPSVGETNIYSQSDAVVDPATGARPDAPAIRVDGTHVGLIVNSSVYRHVAHVLAAQAEAPGERASMMYRAA
jgi:pimeloyl-ACP methyl ester carboxylesterase